MRSETQLTVQQLLDYLQTLVKKDPNLKDANVCHVERGLVENSFLVAVDTRTDKYNENEQETILVISKYL